jgi:hypothetical protein|tara:strand:- start:7 stop:270 length:264 start_codon:yes stop_codon:yes gene_type:complete
LIKLWVLPPGDIEGSSRFRTRKYSIGLYDISELFDVWVILSGFVLRRSYIWMMLLGEGSISLLNLLWSSVTRNIKDGIVILFGLLFG